MADRYYEILGLTPDAGPEEIAQAYEVLARTYHPNESAHPHAQENFEQIREAYAVLSDPQRKAKYDAGYNTSPAGPDRQRRPDISRYTAVIQKIVINIAIFLIIAVMVFHGVAIMKAPPGDNDLTGNLSTALASDTLPSQKDQWARQIKEAMDPENPVTRDYALSLIDASHPGERTIAQLCDIWEKTYRDWTYVSDPRGFEYFSPASNTITIGLKGDCDDFAILIASLAESTSGSARVILAQGAEGGGHAYAEVYVTDNIQGFASIAKYITRRYNCQTVAYHVEYGKDMIPAYWLNLDWQSGHPGGEFYNSTGLLTAYYSDGHWHTSVSKA